MSDATGNYKFINLVPGEYIVRCQTLEGTVNHDGGQPIRFAGERKSGIDFHVAPFKKGTWRSYTLADGVPGPFVRNLLATPGGDLWFTTLGGVARFDGSQFTTYSTEDGLGGDNVWAMLRDPDGTIWFGGNGGLTRFDGKNWKTWTRIG